MYVKVVYLLLKETDAYADDEPLLNLLRSCCRCFCLRSLSASCARKSKTNMMADKTAQLWNVVTAP